MQSRSLAIFCAILLSGMPRFATAQPEANETPVAADGMDTETRCTSCGGTKAPVRDRESPEAVARARKVIARHQREILRTVLYTAEEMRGFKEEFREYYRSDVLPRLTDIAGHIAPDAMHWVDVDWDQKDELVFWTEGLAPSDWGAKEYLFVVRLHDDGGSSIVARKRLNPSRGAGEYRYVRFWKYPNRDQGFNDFVRAVMSYAMYGASGSTFYTLIITWNRYQDQLEIREVTTPFPVAPEGL